jgi:hypothetical protein
MATLWVTEYGEPATPRGVVLPIAKEPRVANQAVTFTTSTQSSAFNAETRYVRIVASVDCHLEFGSSPTATTSTQKLFQGQEAWRAVTPAHKVAAYDGVS